MVRKRKDTLLETTIQEGQNICPDQSDKKAQFDIINGEPKKEKKYILQTRYECWTQKGKDWCNWFTLMKSDSIDELKAKMKDYKQTSVNKIVHLKDDFQIIENPKYSKQ